ncbi:MAG: signal peptidase I [Rickettsiales bacterium]|nr:signal peptidase I [Rickettsiales bacterium]
MFKKKLSKEEKSTNVFLDNLKVFLEAVIIALIIRSFVFEPFHIPSGSMKDGLLEGDFIFVTKYSYGYSKYSFPLAIIPFKDRIFNKEPERGEVIVFRLPSNPSINYIKRLVALPGDEVQVKDGILYINDQELKQIANGFYEDSKYGNIQRYTEINSEGKEYNILNYVDNSLKDNTAKFKVPQDQYFFMGDNRDNSMDSRFMTKVGFIPKENLIGKARFIFMSSEDSLFKFWKWHNIIRIDRIFQKII